MASEDIWTAQSKLQIPEEFRRGVVGTNYRTRTRFLIGWMIEELGVSDLSEKSVLDIGCGVNFTEAFYGLGVPVKRYHGVEVAATMVKFLQGKVQDARFSYKYIAVDNARYHPRYGKPLAADTDIGVSGEKFDVVCLCSVFTHLAPTITRRCCISREALCGAEWDVVFYKLPGRRHRGRFRRPQAGYAALDGRLS